MKLKDKAIFLDIDGVLNTTRSALANGMMGVTSLPKYKRAMIDTVGAQLVAGLARAAGADIVISSSWGNDMSIQELSDVLNVNVVDKTKATTSNRGYEIKQYLDGHPEVSTYVILDDSNLFTLDQKPYLVKINPNEGLTFKKLCRAADILNISVYDIILKRTWQQ